MAPKTCCCIAVARCRGIPFGESVERQWQHLPLQHFKAYAIKGEIAAEYTSDNLAVAYRCVSPSQPISRGSASICLAEVTECNSTSRQQSCNAAASAEL